MPVIYGNLVCPVSTGSDMIFAHQTKTGDKGM